MNTDQKNKTIIRSFRVTEKQDAIISKKAYDRGMSYGAYVALSATCGDEQFDPTKSVHMQNVINIAKQLARKYNPEVLEILDREEAAIWSM